MKISTSKVFASALVAIMFSVFSTSNSKAAEALKIGPAEISFNAGYVTQTVGEVGPSSSFTKMCYNPCVISPYSMVLQIYHQEIV